MNKILLALLGMTFLFFLTNNAIAETNISDCGSLSAENEIYFLTDDIIEYGDTENCMVVTANNITLDCQGHTIDASYPDGAVGVYMTNKNMTTVRDCVFTDWGEAGIYMLIPNADISNHNFTNNTFINNQYGVECGNDWGRATDNIITTGNIFSNNDYAIYLIDCNYTYFYNNLINDTVYFGGTTVENYWNTTNQSGTRIIYSENFTDIGGNYWTNSTGNGFSDTCADSNDDGFCDSPYEIDENNIDYLPLAYPTEPPSPYNISDCTQLNVENETYYLTQDITESELHPYGCIDIRASNIILDCQNHFIAEIPSYINAESHGVMVYWVGINNVTIKNCMIKGWYNDYQSYSYETLFSGIYISGGSNHKIENCTFANNSLGIQNAGTTTVIDSRFSGNNYSMSLQGDTLSAYNNLFNDTSYTKPTDTGSGIFNTTRQAGTRIIYSESFTEIGGNYWTNSTGDGFSDVCTDANFDGFCDSSYEAGSYDYLPLTYPRPSYPSYSDNSTNSTINAVLHSLKWEDYYGLSGYIFSFDNCTGILSNDTWVEMTGTLNWSNATKNINVTGGCTIRWCVYANNTNSTWNGTSCENPFTYTTPVTPPEAETPAILFIIPLIMGAGFILWILKSSLSLGSSSKMGIVDTMITIVIVGLLIGVAIGIIFSTL